jgi:hypothetical protein
MNGRESVCAVLAIVAVACGGPGAPAPPAAPEVRPPAFVGTTWLSVDPAAPRGTIRIFLADGTLVMDSCFETYRLARWESLGGGRVAWQEDTARIEAEVVDSTPGELRLRLRLTQEIREERYRAAPVPFVCPDAR